MIKMKFDFSNILSENVENGLSRNELISSEELIDEVKNNILGKMNSEYFALKLPGVMLNEITEIETYARYIQSNFENFVVVGMGGSSLGNEMLHFGLKGIYYNLINKPKMYFLDNIDPESTLTLLNSLDLVKTVFNIITKSGDTTETLQNFLLIVQELKKRNLDLNEHLVFTTDPKKGFLRKNSEKLNVKTFPIYSLVGGRYSVLSYVGLLSAAVEGIDIRALLQGAHEFQKSISEIKANQNPSFLFSLFQYLLLKKKRIRTTVLFSYSDGLRYLGEWYIQLLAESIGKRYSRTRKEIFSGILPFSARGASDQHSVLQLFIEGPADKLFVFICPEQYRFDNMISSDVPFEVDNLKHLLNKKYSELIINECKATKASLSMSNRTNMSIVLKRIDEFELGKLIYFLELSVISLGELLNVNPIDQPAVELGKRLTYGLMGKENFVHEKELLMKTDEESVKFELEF